MIDEDSVIIANQHQGSQGGRTVPSLRTIVQERLLSAF